MEMSQTKTIQRLRAVRHLWFVNVERYDAGASRSLCDGNELFVMNCDEYETLCDDGANV